MSHSNLFHYAGLSHGGNVLAMAKKYNIAEDQWLDLSTGLNPDGWPVPRVPEHIWQALPQEEDELQAIACEYYGCDYCLPVAGSQAAIQILPQLRNLSNVGIVSPTYAEHEYAWRKAGHNTQSIKLNEVVNKLDKLDVLVVINPNNPTGQKITVATLLSWQQKLSNKGGWLIVDEAFMDVTPELSLLSVGMRPGLIILRSLGKFFGLAGVRCGFVMTDKELLTLMKEKLGPWSVSGPSRYIAIQALKDTFWHTTMRAELKVKGERLLVLLKAAGFTDVSGTALFQWARHPEAKKIFDLFAQQGILLRLFNENVTGVASLRFGLPKTETQWQRLAGTLNSVLSLFNMQQETLTETPSHV